ncbi:hypothetical protein ACLOJK_039905 [Asimina triloba]
MIVEKNFSFVTNHFRLPSLKKLVLALNAASCPFLADIAIGGFLSSSSYVVRTPHSLSMLPGPTNQVKTNQGFQSFIESDKLSTAFEFLLPTDV